MRCLTPGARRAARTAAAAGVLLLSTLLPGAALAADTGAATAIVARTAVDDGTLELVVSVPETQAFDLASARVSVGGEQVDANATPGGDEDRTTVIALDTGEGMSATDVAAAREAALAYLGAVPDDAAVGLVRFGDDAQVVQAPTRDRDALRRALTGLAPGGGSALYDGIVAAADAVGTPSSGARSLLLLTAGPDSTSRPLSEALRALASTGAALDVVALRQAGTALQPLQLLTERGGSLTAVDGPGGLAAAFRSRATGPGTQVSVTAVLPDGAAPGAPVVVSLPSDGGALTATTVLPDATDAAAGQAPTQAAPEPAAAQLATPPGGWQVSDLVALGGVAAIGVGLLGAVMTATLVRNGPGRDDKLRAQLEAYGVVGAPGQQGAESTTSVGDQVRDAAEKVLAGHAGLEARIAAKLDGGGLKLKPAEWLLLHGALTLGTGLLALLLGSGSLALLLLGLALGAVGPWVFLSLKRTRRLRAFSAALPDVLQLMSGSLSAGLSLGQSIDTIVREGGEPVSGEFRRVVVEGRLGVPFEDALAGVGQRMQSKDFEWVVMAIRIQREVGGNLAELLLQVAATLREREYLRRHVRALSAEGRLSAWVLGGLPPGFLAYLLLARPDYVMPLFTDPRGWIMLGGAVLLIGIGALWMAKAGKVEV